MLFADVPLPYPLPLAVLPVAFFLFVHGLFTGRSLIQQILLLIVIVLTGFLVFCQANCAWELVWTNESATCDCDALLDHLLA